MTIQLKDFSLSAGSKPLFADANVTLTGRKRYGIVGPNGAGKSTLLRCIAGELDPSEGRLIITKGTKIGFLKQDQHLHDTVPVMQVVLQGRPALYRVLQEKEELLNSPEWNDEKAHRISDIEEEIGRLDGYSAEGLAAKLLVGLGIPEERHEEPLSAFSGGYKLRVLLARTLFDQPNILLLDEPTNYLDIVAIAWLERYLLQDFDGLLLLVSHDHDLLNNLTTHILDIDYGEVRPYTGNYDTFLKLKSEHESQLEHRRKHIQSRINEMRRFIEKFGSKPTKARQCQARQKMIERLEMPESLQSIRQKPNFNFTQKRPSGRQVLKAKGIEKSYANTPVLYGLDLTIERGQKIALLGPNGAGKTTLIKILTNHLRLDAGTFEWGHATHLGYFAQVHREQLKGKSTLFDWFKEQGPCTDLEARAILGAALFTKDDVNKEIDHLSGGEMARLLLARIMLLKPNVLVLDEPTNHLDTESIEALSEALNNYPGTTLMVSHDRHFVQKVANTIIALEPGELLTYPGSLSEYLDR